MKNVNQLTIREAHDLIEEIVNLMYLEPDNHTRGTVYNPDKEIEGADFIQEVAYRLNELGLAPEELNDEPQ